MKRAWRGASFFSEVVSERPSASLAAFLIHYDGERALVTRTHIDVAASHLAQHRPTSWPLPAITYLRTT